MRRSLFKAATMLLAFAVLAPGASASQDAHRANLWIYPAMGAQGALVDDMIDHPETWAKTRAIIKGMGFRDLFLAHDFSDERLQKLFAFLKRNGLALQLEVGAVKPWGETGQKAFAIERKIWDRFVKDGADIDSVMLDEPLVAATASLKKDESYAAEETANFIALVRRTYPNIRIGDIEPYPSFSSDDLLAYLDDLQARLREKNVGGLDVFRVDVDWNHFLQHTRQGRFGWRGVVGLEEAIHKRGLPFSLVYWAATFGDLNRANALEPTTWDDGVTREARWFAAAGGKPDEIVVETWVAIPTTNTPETDPSAFTKSVLDVYHVVCAHAAKVKACAAK